MEKSMPISVVAVIISVISIISAVAAIALQPVLTIGAGDVGTDELANNSVTGDKIADGAVALTDLASDVIVTLENIADNSITSAKIQDGTITDDDVVSAGISKIADDAVGSAEIADGAVQTSDLAIGAVNQVVQAVGTTNATTDNTTWVDVPDMTVNITTENSPVLIIFSMNVGHVKTTAGAVWVQLLVDGTVEAGCYAYSTENYAWGSYPITATKLLDAGAHTITVQWKVDTGSAGNYVGNYPEAYHRRLTVIELKNALYA